MRWHLSLYKEKKKKCNGLFYPTICGPFYPTLNGPYYPTLKWPFSPDPNNVTMGVLGRICKALNCEITDIMEFVED
jgi:hypothetical protein